MNDEKGTTKSLNAADYLGSMTDDALADVLRRLIDSEGVPMRPLLSELSVRWAMCRTMVATQQARIHADHKAAEAVRRARAFGDAGADPVPLGWCCPHCRAAHAVLIDGQLWVCAQCEAPADFSPR